MEHQSNDDINCNWCARYSHKKIGTGAGGLGNKMTSGDNPNYSIFLDRPDYYEESRRLEETCSHSDSSGKPSANAVLHISRSKKIIIPKSIVENETLNILWDFEIQTHHLILAGIPDLLLINEKRTYRILDFAVPGDNRVKITESKKKRQVPRPCQGAEKQWNINMVRLEQSQRGWKIQIIALLSTARILKRVLETWGDLRSLKFQ